MFVPSPPEDARSSQGPAQAGPLVVTADDDLRAALARISAAAGCDAMVTADPTAIRGRWLAAPMVLVGSHEAIAMSRAALPRHTAVVVVGTEPAGVDVYAAALALGAADVLTLPDAEPALVQRIADAVDGQQQPAYVVGVIGGRGGAGATTLAVALAVTARRQGMRTMLLDADPLGGGIDIALGAERATGLRWSDLGRASGRISAAALQESLLHVHDVSVLSWTRGDEVAAPPAAMQAALAAACRSHDLVVVDLPRYLDAFARVALERVDTLFVVVPADVRSAAAAQRVTAVVDSVVSDVRLVVRCRAATNLSAAAIARSLGLRLAGEMRTDPRLEASFDRGQPPGARRRGSLTRLASQLIADTFPSRLGHAA